MGCDCEIDIYWPANEDRLKNSEWTLGAWSATETCRWPILRESSRGNHVLWPGVFHLRRALLAWTSLWLKLTTFECHRLKLMQINAMRPRKWKEPLASRPFPTSCVYMCLLFDLWWSFPSKVVYKLFRASSKRRGRRITQRIWCTPFVVLGANGACVFKIDFSFFFIFVPRGITFAKIAQRQRTCPLEPRLY